MMDKIPRSGEFYQDYNKKLYQIITVADHWETGAPLVIYQALYGRFKTYAMPLELFLGEVDHRAYSETKQIYQFELVQPEQEINEHDRMQIPVQKTGFSGKAGEQPSMEQNWLLEILDADRIQDKLEILSQVRGPVRQRDLDSLYVALDMPPAEGNWQDQLDQVRSYLRIRLRYEGERLR